LLNTWKLAIIVTILKKKNKEDKKTLIIQVIYNVKCHQKISDGVSKRHVPRILRQDEVIRTDEHSFESQHSITFHVR
jgi:hypothetical protein